MKVLAFDYGASSGRAILGEFKNNKLTLQEIHRFSNDPVMVQGTLYWDILRLFFELKQGLLAAQKAGHADVTSIGIDTWGVDFGLIDKNGALVGNPVHYRDGRTNGIMEELFKEVPKAEVYQRTGLQFLQFNTLYQLYYLVKNKPELLNQADTILFIPDLLAFFLTGNKICEATIASTSQMINPKTRTFDAELLAKIGIPISKLPQITQPGTAAGKLSEEIIAELGLAYNPTLISVAQHDTASAVMAVPAEEENFAYLSSGTWSLLGAETKTPYINETTYKLDFTNEGGYNNTTRLLKNIMGLWILQECKRQWEKEGKEYSFSQLCEIAMEAKPFQCLINPDDALFMPPFGMVDRIKSYCQNTGQYVPQTDGEVVRCIFESLALTYKKAITRLESILGYPLPVLHIVGGGSQNTTLCQFTANAIAKPVVAGPVEATAIGNIVCQLIALGEIKDLSQARQIIAESFPTKTYQPENIAPWEEAYVKFCNIIGE